MFNGLKKPFGSDNAHPIGGDMNIKGKKIWMNGEFVDWNDANIHIMVQTLHYGLGAFEGIRCYKLHDGRSSIFRLDKHMRRMFDTAKIILLEPPYSKREASEACAETVRANGYSECYLRPIMYVDAGGMGLGAINRTSLAIAAWEWGTYLGEGALENGIRVKISSFNRHHINVGMVQGKINGQYVTSILAKREIMAAGYDEAIMLDTNGYVAEGSGENLFAIRDGVIYTAPINSPILPGITRNTILQLARERNYDIREERFTRDFLYICDEVFLTGTAAEVTPVREVDDRNVGSGKRGPITQELQNAYFDAVRGRDEKHQDWLFVI